MLCFCNVSFLNVPQPAKNSVLPATCGALQHIWHVITFWSSWKTTQGNSSFHCDRNLRLVVVLDFLTIPLLSSAFSTLLFMSFLLFPLLELAGFVAGFAGDDLKNDKIVPCLKPVLLVVSPAAGEASRIHMTGTK